MGSDESGDRVFHQRGMNCPSDKVMCSESMFYGSNWDQIVSLSQSGHFGNSTMISQNEFMLENQAMGSSSSHLVQFPSHSSGLVDLVPRIPGFRSGNFSEIATSFEPASHSNLAQETSPYGKRKREVVPLKNAEEEHKDPSGDTSEFPKEDEEKKRRNTGQSSRSKQAKDDSNGAELSKDDYIHVRAKRGQATNSHSLAERVRRERISERMRLLQELVPGCNKITGKAMMLDEIINYVQSLQQQVEFLSMKLATVNPELNVDIDRILSKDILLRGSNGTALGIAPGLISSNPFPGYPQGAFNAPPSTNALFHSLPQHVWNNELHGILQLGFDPDPSVSMGPNGMSKMEL
ncbi:hypothetical protein ACS0TY_025451 [Phlomoides rotata]